MTDIEHKLPVDDTNESPVEDAELNDVVGGSIVKLLDASTPKLHESALKPAG